MDELKQNETKIATMVETQISNQSSFDAQTESSIEKREEAKKKLFNFVEHEQEKKALPKQSISLDKQEFSSLEDKKVEEFAIQENEKELQIVQNEQEEIETEIQEEEIDADVNTNLEEQTVKKQKIVYLPKQKNNFKLRLKLAICAIVCVLTCLGGWAIYNAIEIKTLTAEAQAKNAQYSINVAKVISNTSKLDDLTNPNSITNLDELEKANIIEIIPKEKTYPQTIEKKSNWFDRICNWLSNLFK